MISAIVRSKWVTVNGSIPYRAPAIIVTYPFVRFNDLDTPTASQTNSPLYESKVEIIVDDEVFTKILLDHNYGPGKVISSTAVLIL